MSGGRLIAELADGGLIMSKIGSRMHCSANGRVSPNSTRRKLVLAASTALASLGIGQRAHATSYSWIGGASGDWNSPTNWGPTNGTPLSTSADTITFNGSTSESISLDSAMLGSTTAIGTLNFSNTGTTTLLGGTSTFAGSSTIYVAGIADSSGTGAVTIGDISATPTRIVNILSPNASFANNSSAALTFANGLTSDAATGTTTFTFAGSGNINVNGAVSNGTGSNVVALADTNYGTVTLAASNAYTGATAISNGILEITNANALGSTSGITVNGSAGANTTFAGALALAGNITAGSGLSVTVNSGGANEYYGALSNVSGTNTWAGGVVVGTGTARIGVETGLLDVSGVVSGSSGNPLTIRSQYSGGTIDFSGANIYAGSTSLLVGILQIGGPSVGSATSITSGPVGTGTLNINAASGFSVQLSSDSTTGRTILNPVVFGGTNAATLGDTTNTGALTFAGTVSLGAATQTLTLDSNVEFDGVISNGGLTEAGAGSGVTLALNGANSYSGATTLTAGTLILNGTNSSAGSTAVTAGTLQLGNTTANDGGLASGTLSLSGGTLQNTSGGAVTIANPVSLTASSTVSGAQSLTVGGALTQTASSTLTSSITGGNGLSLGTVYLNSTAAGTNTLTVSGTGPTTFAGAISNYNGTSTGSGRLTITSTGSVVLSGSNSYSGGTTVSSGSTLQLQANLGNTTAGVTMALSNNSILTLASGSTLQLRSDTPATFMPASIATIGTANTNNTLNIDVGELTSAGAGTTLTLSGGLTFATNTTGTPVNAINITSASGGDTLALGAINAPSSGAGTYVFNLDPTTAAVTIGSFTTGSYGSFLTFTGTNTATLNGLSLNSNSSDGITVNGGTVVLDQANAATGSRSTGGFAANLTGGTMDVNNAGALSNPSGSQSASSFTFTISGGTLDNTSGSAITLSTSPTITLANDFTFGGTEPLSIGTGAVTLNGAAGARIITTNGSTNALTIGGVIGNGTATGLTKSGSGTLDLTNATSTYTGVTTIDAGILNATTFAAVNTASSIGKGTGSVGDLVFGGGSLQHTATSAATTNRLFTIGDANGSSATLDSSASSTSNPLSFTGTGSIGITYNAPTSLTLTGTNAGSNTFAPILADPTGGGNTTSLTKTGVGTWVISGADTYTGATTVNGGTLTLTGSLSSSSALVLGGGTFTVKGQSSGTTSQMVAGTTLNAGVSGIAVNHNGGASTTLNLGAVTRNTGAVVSFVPNTVWSTTTPSSTEIIDVALTGNTFTVPTSGTSYVGAWATTTTAANTNGPNPYVQVNSGGQLLAGTNPAPAAASGMNSSTVYTTYAEGGKTLSASSSAEAIVGDTSGSYNFVLGAYTLTLNGYYATNTGSWDFTSTTGHVIIGSENDLVINAASNQTEFDAPIVNGSAGTSNVTITGANPVVFTGANAYSGVTTIAAGNLLANSTGGNSATGSGNVNVLAGASNYGGGKLGGSGTVSGSVSLVGSQTATQGGIIAAGPNSTTTGKLTTGSETWNGGAAYQWKIAAAGTGGQSGGSGGSGTTGTSGTWDDVSMSALSLSSVGGSNQPITIELDNAAPLSATSGGYSWIIAQTTSSHVSGFSGAFAGTAYEGQNLLAQTLTGAASGGTNGNAAFALDTSTLSFAINGVTPSSSLFSLEFVSNGTGDNLVLDYNTAPEPGTTMLVLGGAVPTLLSRRRRKGKFNAN
jgi:fibronectin-binding autotransporter adhesin